jgi:hypothetical protein
MKKSIGMAGLGGLSWSVGVQFVRRNRQHEFRRETIGTGAGAACVPRLF